MFKCKTINEFQVYYLFWEQNEVKPFLVTDIMLNKTYLEANQQEAGILHQTF